MKNPITDDSELAEALEHLDPASLRFREAEALKAITDANAGIAEAKERLLDAVVEARRQGMSWGPIGAMLGITRQAARTRFSDRVEIRLGS
jgi:hypothetical protein